MTIIEMNRSSNEKGVFGVYLMVNDKKINVVKFGTHINVLQENAAHRVWRGGGKLHESYAVAKGAYKSAEMKAAIEYAEKVIG